MYVLHNYAGMHPIIAIIQKGIHNDSLKRKTESYNFHHMLSIFLCPDEHVRTTFRRSAFYPEEFLP